LKSLPLIFASRNYYLELRLETRKAIVKARMMTGSYILQINKHNNNSIDPTCPLCKTDDETIIHLITTCPILSCIASTLSS
jgi:hypothetical protein